MEGDGSIESFQLITTRSGEVHQSDKWIVEEVEADYVLLTSEATKLVLPYHLVEAVYPRNGEQNHWRVLYRGVIMHSKVEGLSNYEEVVPIGNATGRV